MDDAIELWDVLEWLIHAFDASDVQSFDLYEGQQVKETAALGRPVCEDPPRKSELIWGIMLSANF